MDQRPQLPKLETDLLAYWKAHDIFAKTLAKSAPRGEFVFYEGPPTANGRPGIHHLLSRYFKDVIPRYKTMQGFHVARKAGWDTHGLPVELQVEKTLGFSGKPDIEKYGIAAFNKKCKESVWTYLEEWQRFTERSGFWLDMEHPYVTYETPYMESVWSIFREIWNKGLVVKGYKVVHYCPRCGTPLSSHEVAQGYKDDTVDPAVTVKFRVRGKNNEFLLAWTTTPWTLPGNVALAVGKDITYVRARQGDETYILAKDRLNVVLGAEAEIVEELSGAELLGIEYEPLYSFVEYKERAHYVAPADFVSTTDGTGIVHTAVMYGEDDFKLGQELGLPQVHLVGVRGEFLPFVTPFAGKFVKAADPEIIAELSARGLILKQEKIKHTYPFCWRCDTPLLYYAIDSWYISMSRLRQELTERNKLIHWIPDHFREGRFGEWLAGAKDWAISRHRYWATPLPIWTCQSCQERACIGALTELENQAPKNRARVIIMRHGEAETNLGGYNSCYPEKTPAPKLTESGKVAVRAVGEQLAKTGVDLIVASDLARTRETAEILQRVTGAEVRFDERLRELNIGIWNGDQNDRFVKNFSSMTERIAKRPENGENLLDVRARMVTAVTEIARENSGKTVVIISHGDPLWVLETALAGVWGADELENFGKNYIKTGETRELKIPNWPFSDSGELDLHRPYIDDITLQCSKCAGLMRRESDLIDVWFDSGAMPFAQHHFPFENRQLIEKGGAYPAEYICEAVDQTRGWFYTLLAIAVAADRATPYKNVICLGHINDKHGKKMSKSKGNVVNPWEMFDKYGSDAVRFLFFTMSPEGEPKRFDEKLVDEVVKKVFLILWNVALFRKMYGLPERVVLKPSSNSFKVKHLLDRWVLSRLASLTDSVTDSLERYEIVQAARFIPNFITDLSTWYVRRSRDRIKGQGASEVSATLDTVFSYLLPLLAPFAPFFAEALYQELGGEKESVHLEDWPATPNEWRDQSLEDDMANARALVTRALEARANAKIPVRQALAKLTITFPKASEAEALKANGELLEILRDEINVEEIAVLTDAAVPEISVVLDTELTPALLAKGARRDLARRVNALRRELGLTIADQIVLRVEVKSGPVADALRDFENELREEVRAREVCSGRAEAEKSEEFEIGGMSVWIGISRV